MDGKVKSSLQVHIFGFYGPLCSNPPAPGTRTHVVNCHTTDLPTPKPCRPLQLQLAAVIESERKCFFRGTPASEERSQYTDIETRGCDRSGRSSLRRQSEVIHQRVAAPTAHRGSHRCCRYFHRTRTHTHAGGESLSCAVMEVLSRRRRLPRTTLTLLSCRAARLRVCQASGPSAAAAAPSRAKKKFQTDLSRGSRGPRGSIGASDWQTPRYY